MKCNSTHRWRIGKRAFWVTDVMSDPGNRCPENCHIEHRKKQQPPLCAIRYAILPIACFSISTQGTFLSLPDSSRYIRQVMPGEFAPGKASFPSIQMKGDPLMPLLTASS